MTAKDPGPARARSVLERAFGVRLTRDEALRTPSAASYENLFVAKLRASGAGSTLLADARRDVLAALDAADLDASASDALPRKGRVAAWKRARERLGVRLPYLRWTTAGYALVLVGALTIIGSLVLSTRVLTVGQQKIAGHVALHVAFTVLGGWLLAMTNRMTRPPWPLVRVRDVANHVVLARAAARSRAGGAWTPDEVKDVVAAACELPPARFEIPAWMIAIAMVVTMLAFFVFVVVATAPRR